MQLTNKKLSFSAFFALAVSLLFFFCTSFPDRAILSAAALTMPKQAADIFYSSYLEENHSQEILPPPEGQTEQTSVNHFLGEVHIESSSKIPLPLLEESQRDGRIYAETLKFSPSSSILSFGSGLIRNDTLLKGDKVINLAKMVPEFSLDLSSDQPQVLIFHTHATESYDLYDCGYYPKNASARSDNKEQNMIAVGKAICAQLEKAGIAYIHDQRLYDSPSYNGSYQRSGAAVEAYLKEYPSIQVVLDIHRDAAYADDGGWRKFVSQINGRTAAQIMIISGCENGELGNPNWDQNLRFAARLQDQLESDWPGLTRPLYFCYRNYNQHLSPGALLIEMGTHGNALHEAVYSGELLGKSLASLLEKLEKTQE